MCSEQNIWKYCHIYDLQHTWPIRPTEANGVTTVMCIMVASCYCLFPASLSTTTTASLSTTTTTRRVVRWVIWIHLIRSVVGSRSVRWAIWVALIGKVIHATPVGHVVGIHLVGMVIRICFLLVRHSTVDCTTWKQDMLCDIVWPQLVVFEWQTVATISD